MLLSGRRSFLKPKVQAQKEPTAPFVPVSVGQAISHKLPDGASIIPWKRGRNVAWDLTVSDTYAAFCLSHIRRFLLGQPQNV